MESDKVDRSNLICFLSLSVLHAPDDPKKNLNFRNDFDSIVYRFLCLSEKQSTGRLSSSSSSSYISAKLEMFDSPRFVAVSD